MILLPKIDPCRQIAIPVYLYLMAQYLKMQRKYKLTVFLAKIASFKNSAFFLKNLFFAKNGVISIYSCISRNWRVNHKWGEIEFYLLRHIFPQNVNAWAIYLWERVNWIYFTQSLFCWICKWKPMMKIWIYQAISDQFLKFWTFLISTQSQVSETPIGLIPTCLSRLEMTNQKAYR